jgi:predicted aldo/keto reductase-like oxidoreductase
MQFRTLGRTGLEVGVIGLGTEHLEADRQLMDDVVDVAVAGQVNYIDLFSDPSIHTMDQYVEAIAPAVKRHRNMLSLSLHWGFVAHEPLDDCQAGFDLALEDVAGGYAEIAMLTMVDTETCWNNWAKESIERLRGYQRDGRIGFIGIASHNVGIARSAVESSEIDVLMFPVNIYQHHGEPDRSDLLEICRSRDVGVVAMKAYHGGRLLKNEGHSTGISPVQCLNYVLEQPVATTVPGARNVRELSEAIAYFKAPEVERTFFGLEDNLAERLQGQCVDCRHCLPCPQEIVVPDIISILDYVEHFGGAESNRRHFSDWYAAQRIKASDCIECGECQERCQFQVDIIGKMRRATTVFETMHS